MSKTGLLGGGDLIWMREAIERLLEDLPVRVVSVWMNKTAPVVNMYWLATDPYTHSEMSSMMISVTSVNELVTSFKRYVESRLAVREAQARRTQQAMRLQLLDWDGFYLNQ